MKTLVVTLSMLMGMSAFAAPQYLCEPMARNTAQNFMLTPMPGNTWNYQGMSSRNMHEEGLLRFAAIRPVANMTGFTGEVSFRADRPGVRVPRMMRHVAVYIDRDLQNGMARGGRAMMDGRYYTCAMLARTLPARRPVPHRPVRRPHHP